MLRATRPSPASTPVGSAVVLLSLSTLLLSALPLSIDVAVGADRRPFTVGAGLVAGHVV